MILNICNQPSILEIIKFIKLLIQAICIIVPIGMYISIMLDFTKGVYSKDNNLGKTSFKPAINRAVAGIIVFLVPTFINVIISFMGYVDSDLTFCIENATPEGIQKAYVNIASNAVNFVKDELSNSSYYFAENAIKDVKDESKKEELKKELQSYEEYIKLNSEILNLNRKSGYKKIKEIEEKIKNISNEEIKEKLSTKFEEIKEKLNAFVGEYPIIPFGEHELYTGLKTLQGESLDSLLKRNGSSAAELDEKIKFAVEMNGVGTRKAAVAAAITLIGSVAETGYQLPYFWGGKWAKIGVNPNWATPKHASSCNEYYFDTQEEINACIQRNKYWAMDCSGFVNWSVIQAVQEVRKQQDTNGGTVIRMNSSTANHAVCDIGDALGTPGHIVLVVGLDDENKRYIIAEESMGLEIDSVPYNGAKGDGYYCIKIDDYID